jgi:hypothetical protein
MKHGLIPPLYIPYGLPRETGVKLYPFIVARFSGKKRDVWKIWRQKNHEILRISMAENRRWSTVG